MYWRFLEFCHYLKLKTANWKATSMLRENREKSSKNNQWKIRPMSTHKQPKHEQLDTKKKKRKKKKDTSGEKKAKVMTSILVRNWLHPCYSNWCLVQKHMVDKLYPKQPNKPCTVYNFCSRYNAKYTHISRHRQINKKKEEIQRINTKLKNSEGERISTV